MDLQTMSEAAGEEPSSMGHGIDSQPRQEEEEEEEEGLGVVEFLKNKHILVAGGTGFLGKVFVERLIKVQPDVGKIYCLIRSNNTSHATERLRNEVFSSPLFKSHEKEGRFDEALERKVVAIKGDITKENLGIEPNIAQELATHLHAIVNSSANTTFNERYDNAFETNTMGPSQLMEFSKRCPHLQVFLHISTAYVNGNRTGFIHENVFKMGDCVVVKEKWTNCDKGIIPCLDVAMEKCLIDQILKDPSSPTQPTNTTQQKMERLSMERVKLYGWQDTYTFTKAMGEMVLEKGRRKDVPLVILRPSIIESSIKHPFPGWLQGNRMMDPFLVSYGKGKLKRIMARPNLVLDVVPVDMVAHAMIASMVKHGRGGHWGKVNNDEPWVYHISSSSVNPLHLSKVLDMAYMHFNKEPCMDRSGNPITISKLHIHNSIAGYHIFFFLCYQIPLQVSKFIKQLKGEKPSKKELANMEILRRTMCLAYLYESYLFFDGRFDNYNTEQLLEKMSKKEQCMLNFNVRSIIWEKYIRDIHMPGLRKHVMK